MATMLSNSSGVQILYGLGLAKAPKPMTPPRLQTTWALLLHNGQDYLPFLIVESF
jgi:hypothetical protein